MSEDLTINLKIQDYPDENILTVTLTECENMICSYNFFFHYHCIGCSNGKKIEWSNWGTSFPYTATRCLDLAAAPNCTQRDLDDINRECNNRILDAVGAESGAQALKSNCEGPLCSKLNYVVQTEKKYIVIVNTSEKIAELKFKVKPFKNWKTMHLTHYIFLKDSLIVPSLRFEKFITNALSPDNE